MNENKELFIDVDAIFKNHKSSFMRKMPAFVRSIIKKLVKQKRINLAYDHTRHLQGIDFIEGVMKDFDLKIEVHGKENIPATGRYIFTPNHPIGSYDSICCINYLSREFGFDTKTIANEMLLQIKNLRSIFIGVNVFGNFNRSYIEEMEKEYASDCQLVIFPAGEVSRIYDGIIQDCPWKKSFLAKAIQHKRDIVPVFIDAKNSKKFYTAYRVRKFFGIKIDLEMMFLPEQLVYQADKTIKYYFGKPIPYTFFDKTKSVQQWCDQIRAFIYKHKQNIVSADFVN